MDGSVVNNHGDRFVPVNIALDWTLSKWPFLWLINRGDPLGAHPPRSRVESPVAMEIESTKQKKQPPEKVPPGATQFGFA